MLSSALGGPLLIHGELCLIQILRSPKRARKGAASAELRHFWRKSCGQKEPAARGKLRTVYTESPGVIDID